MNTLIRHTHTGEQAQMLAFDLAGRATNALLKEARLTPKPGLVDRRSSGAHTDMNLTMLEASAICLMPGFEAMALEGWDRLPDTALRRQIGAIGREAEKTMMATTGGVNTHRGAIWSLGLLVTAVAMNKGTTTLVRMVETAASLACLADTACPPLFSKGKYASRRYHVSGAREQAQQGFPHVMKLALPRLAQSRKEGATEEEAQLDALLAIMTSLSDTCVLSRGGMKAINTMQKGADAVLLHGGTSTAQGRQAYDRLEADMLELNVSPGGAADLLAAALFLDDMAHASSGKEDK